MKKVFFILYPVVLLGLTIFSYLFIDPNFIYLKNIYSGIAFKNRQLITFLYLLIILLFFTFYFLFLLLIHRKLINAKDIKLLIVLTVGMLLFAYPAMLSYDIFNYIATAKVLFFYHENPYIIMPIEFTQDPLLSFTHAANKIALYGGAWISLSAIPHVIGAGNFLITLFSFKLLIVSFYIGSVVLIWKMSKNLISTSLFAFNPLVIIETLVSGHNDIVMIFFALLSFFLLMKKRIIVAFFFLLLAILIKYATLFLIPVFFYTVWKLFKRQKVDWEKIYIASSLSMFVIFLLSPLREEIYPWYAIWFLPFVSLVPQRKILLYVSLAFSFGLLLRYVPFMILGTHFGVTPTIKILATFIPVILVFPSFWLVQNLKKRE